MSLSCTWREQEVPSTAIILRINCHSNKIKAKNNLKLMKKQNILSFLALMKVKTLKKG